MGTIKPDMGSGMLKTMSLAAAGSAAAPMAATGLYGTTQEAQSVSGRIINAIPDLPGTWDDKAKAWILDNPKTAGAIAIGTALVGGGAYLAFREKPKKKKSKKKSTKKKSTKKKSRKSRSTTRRRKSAPARRRARRRGYGTEAQYKRKGGKDVKYTKNGQPYIIQSNGRARFVKRSR